MAEEISIPKNQYDCSSKSCLVSVLCAAVLFVTNMNLYLYVAWANAEKIKSIVTGYQIASGLTPCFVHFI